MMWTIVAFDIGIPKDRAYDREESQCMEDGCERMTEKSWCYEHRGHDVDYAGYGGCE